MKVLAIGNSFSDDSMEYLYPVLQALGMENISLGNLYIGGCEVQRHVDNIQTGAPLYEYRTNTDNEWKNALERTISDGVCEQAWEVVTMQQGSHDSGRKETYQNLPTLIEFVRSKLGQGVKLLWNMTWAYQQDSTHPGFANYQNDQKTMYNAILDAVQSCVLPTGEFMTVIPVGTAVQNARTSYLGDTLTRDGFHLSIPFGRYLAALTWGRVLTGKPLGNVSYAPEGVTEEMKAIAIESAENAVKSPFAVTQSSFVSAEK